MTHNLNDIKMFPSIHVWQGTPNRVNVFSKTVIACDDTVKIHGRIYEIRELSRIQEANSFTTENNPSLAGTMFYEIKLQAL